jgi:hypothetical protein
MKMKERIYIMKLISKTTTSDLNFTASPMNPCELRSPIQRILRAGSIVAMCAVLGAILLSSTPAAAQCDKPGINNRSVAKLNLRKDTAGGTIVDVLVKLSLGNAKARRTNASFDLEIYRNAQLAVRIPQDVLHNDAIKCAINCSSPCGSIFGDGDCVSCSCTYLTWLPVPVEDVLDGDTISAKIVPARGGEPEVVIGDDAMRTVFRSR